MKVVQDKIPTPQLHLQQANNLAQLPLHCLETEYPNKNGGMSRQVLKIKKDLRCNILFFMVVLIGIVPCMGIGVR